MTTNIETARNLLFSESGLRASNFKLYPGTSREVTADQVAEEIVRSINTIAAGDYEDCGVD